ncbi:MAG TPA: amidohydrolase family protein [Gaiellales bacterium]|nr:amidohydrolase family protein [Gaiellales bacterium]
MTPTADELVDRHLATLQRALPERLRVWDAHTHLGVDDDGMSLEPAALLQAMRDQGVERAFTFPLNDPERYPAYRVPNDRVLAWAEESGGALVPFCRLDLTGDPIGEAERCLDRGARGIKLHPRAQRFDFGERGLDAVFAAAAERSVPILIHAGRGLPPIADDLMHLVERHPAAQLILAHGAIADLERIGERLRAHPNVVYDTSIWSMTDLRSLFSMVAPEQVVFASDIPYGAPGQSRLLVGSLLTAIGAGDRTIRDVFWNTCERVAAGLPAERLSEPLLPREATVPLQRMRVAEYLGMAMTLLWTQQPDTPGALGLALRACDGAEPLTDAAEALEAAAVSWAEATATTDAGERLARMRQTRRLVHLATVMVWAG